MHNKLLILFFFLINNLNIILPYPILLFSKLFTDKIFNYYYNTFYYSISAIIKYYYKTNIYIQNKHIFEELLHNNSDNKNTIIMQNHLYQLDCIVVPMLLSCTNKITNNIIRAVTYFYLYLCSPGMGMCLSLSDSVLITNNKQLNLSFIDNCKLKKNDLLYIYPEGSVYCKTSRESNNKYCDDNKLKKMKNCLDPRPGGINILQKNNNIDTIISVCTQYDNIKPSDKYHNAINTPMPKSIYVKFDKHNVEKDKIFDKTVEIFNDIDKYLDKEININEYELQKLNTIEIISLIFHLGMCVGFLYLLYNYPGLFSYIIIVYIVYYVNLYLFIK
jgi:hypothetical protein